jgi:hypothetical protein
MHGLAHYLAHDAWASDSWLSAQSKATERITLFCLAACQSSISATACLFPSLPSHSFYILRAYFLFPNPDFLELTLFVASLSPFKSNPRPLLLFRRSIPRVAGRTQRSRVDISDKVEEILKGTRSKSTYSIQLVPVGPPRQSPTPIHSPFSLVQRFPTCATKAD